MSACVARHQCLDSWLAQKPYITLGSLRENVLYPGADADTPDAAILAALDKVAVFFLNGHAHTSESQYANPAATTPKFPPLNPYSRKRGGVGAWPASRFFRFPAFASTRKPFLR